MELIIFVGLQGSGKSTFFRTHFVHTHTQISKDLMRNNKNRDRRQTQLLTTALAAGESVVVDNTNPTVADRTALIVQGQRYGATIVGYYFNSAFEDCQRRNQQRQGKARVPDVGLYATRKKLVAPTYGEGFDQLFQVAIAPEQASKQTFDIQSIPKECRDG